MARACSPIDAEAAPGWPGQGARQRSRSDAEGALDAATQAQTMRASGSAGTGAVGVRHGHLTGPAKRVQLTILPPIPTAVAPHQLSPPDPARGPTFMPQDPHVCRAPDSLLGRGPRST